MDTLQPMQVELLNWSKSARSPCTVYKVNDLPEIVTALSIARKQNLSVIPHGAGHSYTDAALNTGGIIMDTTSMRRVLSWDSAYGVMSVEPGATLRDILRVAAKDGWWLHVSPSTPDVTIGGCVAMNVNGRNAWKQGPFGAYILSLDVMFPTGELCTLVPERDSQLFHAFVGSMGLLGIITSVTIQLQRISSGYVTIRRRLGNSLDAILAMFSEEEPRSDFMEAWIDGFATGLQLGRGFITCATLSDSDKPSLPTIETMGMLGPLETPLINLASSLGRPIVQPFTQTANIAHYWLGRWSPGTSINRRALYQYTFWPSIAFAGYHAMFPEGVETFHAFVPGQYMKEIFTQVLGYSQKHQCMPVWCVVKQHRSDPFLLSYQVDGFSLELNYQRTHQTAQMLKQVLQQMIVTVIEAGGKFYLAKDHFLTSSQYRKSVGEDAFDTFLHLKQRYDPEAILQSDLFRRVFQP
jgi:decaprenylphospho-beta-D-ribofuranose 2-oxidase